MRWWHIILIAGAAFVLGRVTVRPVTNTVVEYRAINTSALAPVIKSEPFGSRIERVKLIAVREDTQFRDTTKKVSEESPNGLPNSDSVTVELPIRDYTFTDDSTYTITARGAYVESLPTIQFYPQKTTTTQAPRTRIVHGLQVGGGVAMTPKGIQPAVYMGYGFSIRF